MTRSPIGFAGLAILLSLNGCGGLAPSSTGVRTPGLGVAEAALEGGAGQIALQVSEGVLRGSPNNIQAMAIKGDALSLLGDDDGAAAIYQALLAKDPNSIRANIGLGRIRLSKDPAAAEALFQQVLTHAPRDVTALNNLGIARDLQGHHGEAQISYRQALAVNPDLESAQVNLALSMAMSGHGPEAIDLLRAKAAQPGAAAKVKHDYAVVLAMAGKRAEAERILGDDMPPDAVRQMLDSVTGTRTRVALGAATDTTVAQKADEVPPDVVQAPEAMPQPAAAAGARSADAPIAAAQMAASPMAGAPTAITAAMSASPPMVVRPTSTAEPDADAPTTQPVSPIAAAVSNEQPLALPIRHGNATDGAPTQATVPDQEIFAPAVVAMPGVRRIADVRDGGMDTGQVALPEAPPPPPVLRPAPLPPAYQPVQAAAPARAPAEAAEAPAEPLAPPPSTTIATRETAPAESETADVAPARSSEQNVNSAMVQFAAAPSESAANSFWRDLVRRFPDSLAQREPVVIRFEHAGMVFWRLRAQGFSSTSEAQTLCYRMHANGQDCFVPRT